MLILLVILAVFLQIAIAVAMYLHRGGNNTSKVFMLLSLSLAGWAATNYIAISIPQQESTIYAIRTVISFVVIQNTLFYIFAKTFPDKRLSQLSRVDKYFVGYSVFVLMLSQTPFMFESVTINNNTATPLPGPAIVFFIVHAIFAIGLGLRSLYKKFKVATGQKRTQLLLIISASSFLWLIAPVTNFVITLAAKTTIFVQLSPFYTLIFSSIITYAIVAQKLFDVKLIVARSVAYILSLGVLATGYAAISSLIVDGLFPGLTGRALPLAINTAIFLMAVLLYPYIKNFFDRITNKLFYRDGYDPQEFLNELNDSIVSNIEIGILLRHTTSVIEENLKCGFCQIVIPKTDTTPLRIAGTKTTEYSDHELNYLRGRLVGLGKKLVIADDLGAEEDELQKIFNKHDISVIVHLAATSYGQDQTIAYMIFGTKKSGNVYSKQDLGIIDIIADELVIAIQNALRFEEIQDFNVTLQSKVNTATNKLRRTNEKLKLLDETKDEFISMASHQLRTPLTSVKGYLSMVLEGDAGEVNDTQRKLLDQAFVSSQRMVYLIADLLNVSRLRTGKFVIDSHPSNLANLIEGEVAQLKEQAKAKNLTLTYEKPSDFPVLMLDETKIRQVVMNFVDNALYYTPSGGKIDVAIAVDKRYVYFTVKDNGLGVPKDEQKHLFTKFYRAKNARNFRPDGTGLGLFMAKKVVTGQGGNILFESIENKGSTFGFSLPLKKVSTDASDVPKA